MRENPTGFTSIMREDLDTIAGQLDLSMFKGKRILITGGYGMYLLYTTWSLVEAGAKVYLTVHNKTRALDRLGSYADRVYMLQHDLLTPVWVPGRLDYIIHGASPASPHRFKGDPVDVMLPNTVGTWHILELARIKTPSRIVYISTSGVLRQGGIYEPYYASKRAAEALCQAYAQQYGLAVSIVRPEHTYGPTMDLGDSRVFAQFLAAKVDGCPLPMTSDGMEVRLFQYITDATKEVLCALVGLKHPPTYFCRSIQELKYDIEHEATTDIRRTIQHFKMLLSTEQFAPFHGAT